MKTLDLGGATIGDWLVSKKAPSIGGKTAWICTNIHHPEREEIILTRMLMAQRPTREPTVMVSFRLPKSVFDTFETKRGTQTKTSFFIELLKK